VYGAIKLNAVNNITILGQVSALDSSGGSGSASDISLYSLNGAVTQMDSWLDGGTLSEPIHAAQLTVRAATGILLPFTDLTSVSATNTTSGAVSITEQANLSTPANGNLSIALLSQAGSGDLSVTTKGGDLTVAGTVTHTGSGSTNLTAQGTGKALAVNQAIKSTGGAIKLTATGLVTIDDNGTTTDGQLVAAAAQAVEVTSSAGAIQQKGLVSSAGGNVKLTASTVITMQAGTTTTSSVAGAGTVRLTTTTGNVTIASLQAGSNVFVTAGSAILGLAGSNPNIDGETATVLLAATSGIGSNSAAIRTRVGTLAAANTGNGVSTGIFVAEATDLTLAGGTTYSLDAGGTGGAVSVVTTEGTLTVNQAVRSTGTVGNILLQSGETAEGTTADLLLRANVATSNGSISLASADGITLDDGPGATGPTVTVSAAAQFIDVRAADGITMEGLARLSATSGASSIWVQADGGAAVLGTLDAGTAGRVIVSAIGDITDGQADDGAPAVNITGSDVRLSAAGAIGAAGALLETSAATLAARSATGAMFVAETNALTIGSVAGPAVRAWRPMARWLRPPASPP
jgi:hypothetical protein